MSIQIVLYWCVLPALIVGVLWFVELKKIIKQKKIDEINEQKRKERWNEFVKQQKGE